MVQSSLSGLRFLVFHCGKRVLWLLLPVSKQLANESSSQASTLLMPHSFFQVATGVGGSDGVSMASNLPSQK